MDIRHLQAFLRVAQVLSFTRAATDLNYAQSTVTAQVQKLESLLGVSLFERSGGRVRLTTAGERFLPYADRILDLVAEARRAVTEGDEPSGTLVVGTVESITSYRLPPLFELVHHRYPRLRLSLRPSVGSDACLSLRNRVFDVAFLLEAETEHAGLTSVVLREEELVLVAIPEHRLTSAGAIDLDMLRQVEVVAPEAGCAYRDLFEQELNRDQAEPVPLLEFGTIEAIKRSALSGLGVTLLPRITVVEELAEGRLATLPWDPPFRVFTQLAWHQEKWLSRELSLFIEQAVRVISGPDDGVTTAIG